MEGLKIRRVIGITCPLLGIGLTHLYLICCRNLGDGDTEEEEESGGCCGGRCCSLCQAFLLKLGLAVGKVFIRSTEFVKNLLHTPPMPEIIWVKNVRAIVVCGFVKK